MCKRPLTRRHSSLTCPAGRLITAARIDTFGARFALTLVLLLASGAAQAPARTLRVEPASSETASFRALREDRAGSSALAPACAEAVIDSVRYELCLPASVFEFGEPVTMEYKITNQRASAVEFDFGSTCQEFYSILPDPCPEGCARTWPDSPSCFFMSTELVVEPGETRTFVKEWRHHTKDGWRTRAGLYRARAELLDNEYTRLEVPFAVVPYGPEPIQNALDVATAGDTVLVAPGTYYENLLLLAPQRGVVLRSESGPEETILDGGGRGSVLYLGQVDNQTIVEGFTIQNGHEVEDSGTGEQLGGGVSVLSSATVRGNYLRDNESDYGGAMTIAYVASPVLEDNLFLRNVARVNGGALFSGGNALVERSTFVKNVAMRGAGVFDNGIGKRVRTLNCVFYANAAEIEGGAVFCQDDSPPTATYCHVFWENVPDDRAECTLGNFQLQMDPKFCAVDSDDYHLQNTSALTEANSPCGQIGAFGVGCATTQVGDGVTVAQSFFARPNPFRDVVEIVPRSDASSIRRLEIVDASGRQVWAWHAESVTSAAPVVRWTGRDSEGREVPAGVFFLRAWAGEADPETTLLVRFR